MIPGKCPNCGSYSGCLCTWSEQQRAIEILRRQERAYREEIGDPVLVDDTKPQRRHRHD